LVGLPSTLKIIGQVSKSLVKVRYALHLDHFRNLAASRTTRTRWLGDSPMQPTRGFAAYLNVFNVGKVAHHYCTHLPTLNAS
jgi:hypothetical protein